jgi:shikimate dehydrogenase
MDQTDNAGSTAVERRERRTRPLLLGLIGAGIQQSRTPAMHELEGAHYGLHIAYTLIDLEPLRLDPRDLPELLRAAELMGFAGLNITHPCKQEVIPLLDELSPEAKVLGAVNTVVFRDQRRIGHNTDWSGFAAGFEARMPDAPRRHVVQLGAGGAGSAVGFAALTLGAERLSIIDAAPERAAHLAELLNRHFGTGRAVAAPDAAGALAEADGLINTTPVGMTGHPGMPVPESVLRPALWVADIVYFPLETELLATARRLGCRTLGGGDMAVFQAVEAFRLFTGRIPDAERMRRSFVALGAG